MALIARRQLLDHAATPAARQRSIRSGFSGVMDRSLKEDAMAPASCEYNVAVTREVVKFSPAVGVPVEGELGCLRSLETDKASEEDAVGAECQLTHDQTLTDPQKTKDFVAQAGMDALAIAIGTSHGVYKLTRPPIGDSLATDRMVAIHQVISNTHLVMHRSSSVPQGWLAISREHGGDIKETCSVPVEEMVRGIQGGVRKLNIGIDIRLAMTGAMRRTMAKNPGEFDPRKFFKDATVAAKEFCQARFQLVGCAGGGQNRAVAA